MDVEVVDAEQYRKLTGAILEATTGLVSSVDCAGSHGKIFIVQMQDGHVMIFYSWKHFCDYMYARTMTHREATENKVQSDEVLGAIVLAETTGLGFDAFAEVVRENDGLLDTVFGGSFAGEGLKDYQFYKDIATEHANTNFAPQRKLVERAAKLRA